MAGPQGILLINKVFENGTFTSKKSGSNIYSRFTIEKINAI